MLKMKTYNYTNLFIIKIMPDMNIDGHVHQSRRILHNYHQTFYISKERTCEKKELFRFPTDSR